MVTCRNMRNVEQAFDRNAIDATLRSHLEQCPECAEHLEFLEMVRETTRSIEEAPEIGDAQLPSFMRGIQEGIDQPAPRRSPLLFSWVSAAAAVVVVAAGLLSVTIVPPATVEARSIVDLSSTDIDGAEMETYDEDDGSATIWVRLPEGEEW